MSRFLTCASSCAMTPSSSSCGMYLRMPVVTATTACSRVPAGGEGVGLLVRRDRDDRHGQTRPLAQPVHHPVELGRLLLGDHLRAIHPEHELVREEVHDEVERAADDQGEHEALRSPEQLAGEQEQAHQAGHQDHGLDVVHAAPPWHLAVQWGLTKRARPRPLRFRVDEGLALMRGRSLSPRPRLDRARTRRTVLTIQSSACGG